MKPSQTWRQRARSVIGPVVTAHHGQPRKVVRKALREAFDQYAAERCGYAYQVWLEEVRYALHERTRKATVRKPAKPLDESEVMPAMREWAKAKGLTQPEAVLDVHLPL